MREAPSRTRFGLFHRLQEARPLAAVGRCTRPHFETGVRGIGLKTECRKQGVEIRFISVWLTSFGVGMPPLPSAS